MKTVRTLVLASNRRGWIVRGYKYTIKIIHIYSIVHSQFRLTSAFATIFDAGLVIFAYVLSTFPYFVSFAIIRTVSKVKEKDALIRSSANLKSFLNGRFTFFHLKIFFYLSHTYTQIPLSAQGYFFPLPQPFFRIFFLIKPT